MSRRLLRPRFRFNGSSESRCRPRNKAARNACCAFNISQALNARARPISLSRGFMCNCGMQLVKNLGAASCQSLRAPQCVSGVTSVFTSKMSDEDELLLLSAAASAATIALAACSVKRRRKHSIKLFTSLSESFLNDIFINIQYYLTT